MAFISVELQAELTTYALDANINDTQNFNAELSSVLDNQNNTHIAWMKHDNEVPTLVYTLFSNGTFTSTDIQAYPNGSSAYAPQITLDSNGNPHIVYIITRDNDFCCRPGNYAIMYAGDSDGDGAFEQTQISTNSDGANDLTEGTFDAWVTGRPTISLSASGIWIIFGLYYLSKVFIARATG